MVISESNSEKKSDKKEKPLTKVIIRRLPPTIDQETFLNQVSPVPDYNYIYTVKGDLSLGEHAFSRVYINFVNSEDLYSFKERFDNYVFLDNRGHEYPAVVEFAPFQKIPKKRGKRTDPKFGTIESDPIYLEFIESLNKPEQPQQDEKPEYTLQLNKEDKNDVTTPLLEFIKNKRAQRMKLREFRREERERKRREFERKKEYVRSGYDEKSPAKSHSKTSTKNTVKPEKSDITDKTKSTDKSDSKPEKYSKHLDKGSYKGKERKFDDKPEKRKEIKPRFPKKDIEGKPDEGKHAEDSKKDEPPKSIPKKVKKYSERREERKMEAQKAEQKKLEQAKAESEAQKTLTFDKSSVENKEVIESPSELTVSPTEKSGDKTVIHKDITEKPTKLPDREVQIEKNSENSNEIDTKNTKDSDSSNSKRIRNKDRPTIAIYRPGMLSKRKPVDDDTKNSN